jgi:hypothetical protein
MNITLVRYKLKPGKAAENEAYIAKVFEELRAEKPDGLQYASLRAEDGVTFTHIVAATPAAPSLDSFAAFNSFTAAIRDRCEEQPVVTKLSAVGSYHLFETPWYEE